MVRKEDTRWMEEALKLARRALEEGEVPIGAVVVRDGRVIGRGYNRVEQLKDATAHAEIIAIGAASQESHDWRLEGATLYVTLEPCMMCLGAAFLSRLGRIVYGARDFRGGACGGALNFQELKYMDREITIDGGVLESECSQILKEFFTKIRDSKK